MKNIRTLIRVFVTLSDIQKIAIAKKLGLYSANLNSMKSSEIDKELLQKVKEKGLLCQLWEEVNNTNPINMTKSELNNMINYQRLFLYLYEKHKNQLLDSCSVNHNNVIRHYYLLNKGKAIIKYEECIFSYDTICFALYSTEHGHYNIVYNVSESKFE